MYKRLTITIHKNDSVVPAEPKLIQKRGFQHFYSNCVF